MMHRKRNAGVRRSAFTLVDTTIALLILAGLVLIGGLALKSLNSTSNPREAAAAVEQGAGEQ
jgi:type II secretory pathway pseudopilin PulG